MAKTIQVCQDGPANALHLSCSRNFEQVVIAGRTVFKIYNIEDEAFTEVINLRSGKNLNLNFSCNDVAWSNLDENLIATAATNGAVVLWNLGKSSKSKQTHVFTEHSRTVNKVKFHHEDHSILASGSQDGVIKFFDLRSYDTVAQFVSNTGSVRDLQFNPHTYHQFASVSESGKVQLWDARRTDRCEKWWPAHSEHIFTCDWHPEVNGWLATGGRDKLIKIWDTTPTKASLEHTIYTIGPVGQVRWRPQRREHIGSSALVVDFSINLWDIRKPYLPFAAIESHRDVAVAIAWKGNPYEILATSKDGILFRHVLKDASRPGEFANPCALDLNSRGEISYVCRDPGSINTSNIFDRMVNQPIKTLPPEQNSGGGISLKVPSIFRRDKSTPQSRNRAGRSDPVGTEQEQKKVFRRSTSINELFCASTSIFNLYSIPQNPVENGKSPSAMASCSNVSALTDMKWFEETAKRYVLSGQSLDDMCEHNAKVAFSLSRNQIGQVWLTLKTLYGNWIDSIISECSKLGLDPNGSVVEADDEEAAAKADSSKDRHRSSSLRDAAEDKNVKVSPEKPKKVTTNGESKENQKKSKSEQKTRIRHNGGSGRQSSGESGATGRRRSGGAASATQSDDEGDDELDNEANELTLTNIASGQMLASISGDFFGDSELAGLTIEQPVSLDLSYQMSGQGYGNNVIWEIPSEAFDLRHEIRESSTHAEAEEYSQNGEDTLNEEETVTVTVEDQTSSLLCCVDPQPLPPWSPDNVIRDTLLHYADTGDIQTTVSVYLVLGHDRLGHLFQEDILENWFLSYIELLQRFQLNNIAAEVMNMSPLASVNLLSQNSTTFYSNCTACKKALSRHQCGWWCDRCKTVCNQCAVCHKTVKGLFVWCQFCGHGGHLQHLKNWFETEEFCPTGCGHYCQYI